MHHGEGSTLALDSRLLAAPSIRMGTLGRHSGLDEEVDGAPSPKKMMTGLDAAG